MAANGFTVEKNVVEERVKTRAEFRKMLKEDPVGFQVELAVLVQNTHRELKTHLVEERAAKKTWLNNAKWFAVFALSIIGTATGVYAVFV